MSASGTWTTTATSKAALYVAGFLAVGLAMLGVALWPVLVTIGHVLWAVATVAWAVFKVVVWLELAVLFSAALDWAEARVALRSLRHGWLLAHVTMWRRLSRRAGWLVSLAGGVRKQLRKHTTPPAPQTLPVHAGTVLEHDDILTARAA